MSRNGQRADGGDGGRPLTKPERAELERAINESAGPVFPFSHDYPAGWDTGRHAHSRAQLVFAVAGVLRVTTPAGSWIVPPDRAVWVPARMPHALRMFERVRLRTLYIEPDHAPHLPDEALVLGVTRLMREIVLRFMERDVAATATPAGLRLLSVLLDEIAASPPAPLHLPEPRDTRLRRIAEAIHADPGNSNSLQEWADFVGASPRTLTRRFKEETGLGFAAWRQRARLLHALVLLGEGRPVTTVALDLGYESVSAFIAVFRRAFNTTPGRYARNGEQKG